jgi:hypothetical protein
VWATYFQNSSWVASTGNTHSLKFKLGREILVAGSEVSNERAKYGPSYPSNITLHVPQILPKYLQPPRPRPLKRLQ